MNHRKYLKDFYFLIFIYFLNNEYYWFIYLPMQWKFGILITGQPGRILEDF